MLAVVFATFSGCTDFVTVDLPNTKITTASAFEDPKTATAATLAIYDLMLRVGSFGASGAPNSIATACGIYSDEFDNYYLQNAPLANNTLVASNSTVLSIWSSLYSTIYAANAVIEGVNNSKNLDPDLKKQLEGEAMFARAFCQFYLVSLYGDVPLVLSTDFRVNSIAARAHVNEVFSQIITDLQKAAGLLTQPYVSAERGRPNASTATALLARVYLNTGNYDLAEATATKVIGQSDLYSLVPDLNSVFLKNSQEAIWQLVSTVPTSYNTNEGNYFILTAAPTVVALSSNLVDTFDPSDKRLSAWVKTFIKGTSSYRFSYKYKVKGGTSPLAEHSIVLRLAEQYLIRAEARAQLNKIAGPNSAASDLNTIRSRAGLPDAAITTQTDMLLAIEKERKLELFSEWGHRWFDIKRTGRASEILSPLKSSWNPEDQLFPIPEKELGADTNLGPQNAGY